MSEKCLLCPRQCGAVRDKKIGSGFCKSGTMPKIARIAPHYWEEPCISGTNGTGAIFFSGCTLSCVYCQNHEISHGSIGSYITAAQLAEEIKRLESLGVHNISFISGSHYVNAIVEALSIYRPKLPTIFNCGGYENVDSIKKLNGYIDIFLPDFKYAQPELAQRLSAAADYPAVAVAAISCMIEQVGYPVYNSDGLIQSGVIIRHLVLPNHTKNSIEVLKIIKEQFGTNVPISLMSQYFPTEAALKIPDLNRKITKREYSKVLNAMTDLELDGYCQELSSSSDSYVPLWDYNR